MTWNGRPIRPAETVSTSSGRRLVRRPRPTGNDRPRQSLFSFDPWIAGRCPACSNARRAFFSTPRAGVEDPPGRARGRSGPSRGRMLTIIVAPAAGACSRLLWPQPRAQAHDYCGPSRGREPAVVLVRAGRRGDRSTGSRPWLGGSDRSTGLRPWLGMEAVRGPAPVDRVRGG